MRELYAFLPSGVSCGSSTLNDLTCSAVRSEKSVTPAPSTYAQNRHTDELNMVSVDLLQPSAFFMARKPSTAGVHHRGSRSRAVSRKRNGLAWSWGTPSWICPTRSTVLLHVENSPSDSGPRIDPSQARPTAGW